MPTPFYLMTPKEDTMKKLLLKLYVRLLNRDPGTRLFLLQEDGRHAVSGQMRHVVTIVDLSSSDALDVAKALVRLDKKAEEQLDKAAPVLKTVSVLMSDGVTMETILDTLDELLIQVKEGRV